MSKLYFVVSPSEGGGYIEAFDKKGLLEYINELSNELSDEYAAQFLSSIPESNIAYWPENGYLIIEGTIITPKPVEVVKEWDI